MRGRPGATRRRWFSGRPDAAGRRRIAEVAVPAMTADAIAVALGATGLCVVPGFLSAEALRDTRADLDTVQSAGGFRRAGTGQGAGRAVHEGVRRDEIHWLDAASARPSQAALFARLAELRQAFNRGLYLGLQDFEGHYAVYPEGGFYRRHLDGLRGDSSRVVSVVIYLNRDWQAADGGELRVYDAVGGHTSVSPVGGTMVCFLSQQSEHEVLESRRARASFAGWFRRAS